MLQIIKTRKIWLSISSTIVVVSIVFWAIWGLKFGIDFTGGSLLEISFQGNRPSVTTVQEKLSSLDLGSLIIQPVAENELLLRFQNTSEEKHQEILKNIKEITSDSEFIELRYDSVGPAVGQELKKKSVSAIIFVLIAIVMFIAWAFRKVSKPVASWKYGVAATIALFHDVLIVVGVFAFLGKFYNVEVGAPFVAALLTVLGYSVNDTIVVFDRIRENLLRSDHEFEETVNISLNQTIVRSINISLTVMLVLVSILIFGGGTIKDFVLALTIGVFVGTYSSIFIASPVLVVWEKFKK